MRIGSLQADEQLAPDHCCRKKPLDLKWGNGVRFLGVRARRKRGIPYCGKTGARLIVFRD